MYIDVKDLEIMDVSSMDELQDGGKTISLMQSTIDDKNKEFEIELEKHCAKIGMEICSCSPPEISKLTNQVQFQSPEDQVNSYSYHVLVESQGGVYANEQGIIRHCKKCGKNTFYGSPNLMLMGLAMFYNAAISFDEMEINDGDVVEEPIGDDIPENCGEDAATCEGCTVESCTCNHPESEKAETPINSDQEGAEENAESES